MKKLVGVMMMALVGLMAGVAVGQQSLDMETVRKADEQRDVNVVDVPLDHFDYTALVQLYQKADEQGDAEAQFDLGRMFYEGLGVPQIDSEAIRWWQKSAEQDYAPAQFQLGLAYLNEYGGILDREIGCGLLYAAAAQDYRSAIFEYSDRCAAN